MSSIDDSELKAIIPRVPGSLLHHARRAARTRPDGGAVTLSSNAVARLNRAVSVGEADGPRAGLAALAELDESLPRHAAARAYLHERDGDLRVAAKLYAQASRAATNTAERDHLARQSARLNAERCRPAGHDGSAA